MTDYQTDQDLEHQERIASEWAEYRGASMLPIGAAKPRIDYAILGATGGIIGFAEIKRCGWPFGAASFGGGYKLAVDKMTAAAEASFAFSIPVFLVVEFTDALAWLNLNTTPAARGHELKRPDRGSVRNAVLFRWDQFTVDRSTEHGLVVAAHAPTELDPRPPA